MSAPASAPALRVDDIGSPGESHANIRAAAKRTFLGALPAHSLRRLLRASTLTNAAAKALLFDVGEPARQLSILLEGSLALLASADAGRKVVLDIVHPGELVLPYVPAPDALHAVCATALRPSRILNIPLEDLRAELLREGPLSDLVLQAVSRRARGLSQQIENLKLRSTAQRLAGYLLTSTRPGPSGADVVLQHRKHIIASQLGMTPESLSRSFAALHRLGVSMRGQRVSIRNPERLRLFSRHGIDDATLDGGASL